VVVRRHPDVIGILLVVLTVALIRIPLRFDWFGEHDQARFLIDAILYRYEGGDIVRRYYAYTSPLALAAFAGLASIFGNASLLALSNALGVLSGILLAAAVYALSRTLAVEPWWAAATAIGSSLQPGVSFLALYGYPSIYALPLGVASAAAVSWSATCERRSERLCWFGAGAVAFVFMVLLKADFVLLGSLLLVAVALRRKLTRSDLWRLLGLAVVTVVVLALSVGWMVPAGRDVGGFATMWTDFYRPLSRLDLDLASAWHATGIGTLLLLAVAFLAALLRKGARFAAGWLVAWLVAVGPTWAFWGSIHPFSTRHALPGALFTGLFLGWLAARLLPGRRLAALSLPLLIVALNWPWGRPFYDLNYDLAGDLVGSYRVNREAFAASRRAVDRILAEDKPLRVIFGSAVAEDVLGAIDVVPMLRYEMAARSVRVHNQTDPPSHVHLQTVLPGGQSRLFLYCGACDLAHTLRPFRPEDVAIFTFGRRNDSHLARLGIEAIRIDLQNEFERAGGGSGSAGRTR
jgi:hypothetical protein